MTTRFLSPAVAGLAVLTTTLFATVPASAQSVEIDYQCACKKSPKAKKDYCRASSTPTVTVGSSANGKTEAREKAASTQCFKRYKSSCPRHSCVAAVTQVGPERVLTKAAKERRKDAKNAGMTGKQVDALAKYADDENLTIIMRRSNSKSLFYQDEDKAKYRPKPLALNALNTETSGSSAGLITKPSLQTMLDAEDVFAKDADVKAEIQRLRKVSEGCQKDKGKDGVEDTNELQPCGWYFKKKVILDPQKRAVYGDYDLQGVYDGTTLLETNAGVAEGKKRLEKLNEVIDSSRTDKWGVSGEHKIPVQWLIQHGANDNYKKKDGSVGRCTRKNEKFLVAEPDGNTVFISGRAKLKDYYDEHKMKWPYDAKECAKYK